MLSRAEASTPVIEACSYPDRAAVASDRALSVGTIFDRPDMFEWVRVVFPLLFVALDLLSPLAFAMLRRREILIFVHIFGIN